MASLRRLLTLFTPLLGLSSSTSAQQFYKWSPPSHLQVRDDDPAIASREAQAYHPEFGGCSPGANCEDACGPGFENCESNIAMVLFCYHPGRGQKCCGDGSGRACEDGWHCSSGSGLTWCCPNGMGDEECAKLRPTDADPVGPGFSTPTPTGTEPTDPTVPTTPIEPTDPTEPLSPSDQTVPIAPSDTSDEPTPYHTTPYVTADTVSGPIIITVPTTMTVLATIMKTTVTTITRTIRVDSTSFITTTMVVTLQIPVTSTVTTTIVDLGPTGGCEEKTTEVCWGGYGAACPGGSSEVEDTTVVVDPTEGSLAATDTLVTSVTTTGLNTSFTAAPTGPVVTAGSGTVSPTMGCVFVAGVVMILNLV